MILNGNENAYKIVHILIHLVKGLGAEDLYFIYKAIHIVIRLALKLKPDVTVFLWLCRKGETAFLNVFILVLIRRTLCAEILLICIPKRLEGIPTVRMVSVTKVKHLYVVASFLQKLGMKRKKLALGVGHYHRRSCARSSEKLNHRIDKCCSFTRSRTTDNKSVAGRIEGDLHIILAVIEGADRHTVLLHFSKVTVFTRREYLISFSICHPTGIFKIGLDLIKLILFREQSEKISKLVAVDKPVIPRHEKNRDEQKQQIKQLVRQEPLEYLLPVHIRKVKFRTYKRVKQQRKYCTDN